MANSTFSDNISTSFTSLFQGLRENFIHPIGFIQIGAIGVSYLVAWLFAAKIRQFLEKDIDKVKAHMHVTVSPAHFAIIFRNFIWMMLVWFCHELFKKFNMPVDILHMALNLIIAIVVIRLVSFYIKSRFWSYLIYGISLTVVALRIFKLWLPTVDLLDGMTIGLGKISISVWSLTEAIMVFILLWFAAGAANRFIAHGLTASKHLTYSDRTLLQRSASGLGGGKSGSVATRSPTSRRRLLLRSVMTSLQRTSVPKKRR